MSKLDMEGTAKRDLFLVPPEKLFIIGIDTADGPEHPLYDERIKLPIDPNMVADVARFGVLQPIKARRNGANLEVVVGRQRVRWAREANLKLPGDPVRVPTVIMSADDRESSLVMIAENEVRQDDPVTVKSARVRDLVERRGYSVKEVALAFGRTQATIKAWLSLTNLDPTVASKIDSGEVSASAGAALAVLPRERQRVAVEQAQQATAKKDAAKKASAKKGGAKGDAGGELSANGRTGVLHSSSDGDDGGDVPGPAAKVTLRQARRAAQTGPVAPTKKEIKEAMKTRKMPPSAMEALEWVMGSKPMPDWAERKE